MYFGSPSKIPTSKIKGKIQAGAVARIVGWVELDLECFNFLPGQYTQYELYGTPWIFN